jgi:hypothetical protein
MAKRMSRIESLSSVSDMKLSRVSLVSPIVGDFRHRSSFRTQ